VNEKTLLRIALAVSVLGIVALFLLSQQISVDDAMINRLDELVDESVVVTGMVVGVNQMNSTTFIMLEKNEMTSVVVFGKTPLLEIGDLIQVRGRVAVYEDETEIIGEEIRVV
jgi:DNA/RNA endonuclease YhcR with UshA esterase domain